MGAKRLGGRNVYGAKYPGAVTRAVCMLHNIHVRLADTLYDDVGKCQQIGLLITCINARFFNNYSHLKHMFQQKSWLPK